MPQIVGYLCFVLYLACLPVANWMVGNVGTCVPNGPCLIRLWPTEIMTPSGVLMIGLALVLRDMVQRLLGIWASIWAIMIGTFIASLISPAALLIASVLSFLLSEIVDFIAYTMVVQRRGFLWAVVISSVFGLLVDSMMFLFVAFGSLAHLEGQIIGKLVAVTVALPLVHLMRRLAPASTANQ